MNIIQPAAEISSAKTKYEEVKKVKNIFLTGGTGFVGSNFGYFLLRAGYKVIFLVRPKQGVTPQARLEHVLQVIEPGFDLDQYDYEIVLGVIVQKELEKHRKFLDFSRSFTKDGKVKTCSYKGSKCSVSNVNSWRMVLGFDKR